MTWQQALDAAPVTSSGHRIARSTNSDGTRYYAQRNADGRELIGIEGYSARDVRDWAEARLQDIEACDWEPITVKGER